ncbi:uncharacterized protein A4U43_C04F10860 [Asparagus officinalis]|uniref:Uncharacterized protein n=1 Tax=Asparagus officinalis TaxID=4686 RepID=A0A5P1EZX8_ASPOF|nr:uncharacterized protein A4U43_C04F10860 [Asparagus officinalis]
MLYNNLEDYNTQALGKEDKASEPLGRMKKTSIFHGVLFLAVLMAFGQKQLVADGQQTCTANVCYPKLCQALCENVFKTANATGICEDGGTTCRCYYNCGK